MREDINRWMHMEILQHLNQNSGVPLLATFRMKIAGKLQRLPEGKW